MEPEFWLQRWEAGQTGFHLDEVNRHLEQHWPQLGLHAPAGVFVPLCGKSLDLLWLRGQGHAVLGVELSPKAVEAFFAENGLQPAVLPRPPFVDWHLDGLNILQGDFFDLEPDDTAECWGLWDRASLIALPPGMRARYAAHLTRLMPHGCRGLLVTLEYPQAQMDGPPFSVEGDEVERLFGGDWAITPLAEHDVLEEQPRFRERGLEWLTERIWRMERR
ncbi:MAG: thiopurine S-methyltransferase [Gammaproteobacteria bacterium]|nr:MAG: thiopurine S-methyltransferase [Gammaproteobacteria bacterium]